MYMSMNMHVCFRWTCDVCDGLVEYELDVILWDEHNK